MKVPRDEPHGRFTLLMERFVIDVLQACQIVKGACALIGISWDQAWHVLERAVTRGLPRNDAVEIARIGVDEKAFRKGHRYTTVSDIDRGTVDFVSEDLENAFFRPISRSGRGRGGDGPTKPWRRSEPSKPHENARTASVASSSPDRATN